MEQVWVGEDLAFKFLQAEHGIPFRYPREDVKNLAGYTQPNYYSRVNMYLKPLSFPSWCPVFISRILNLVFIIGFLNFTVMTKMNEFINLLLWLEEINVWSIKSYLTQNPQAYLWCCVAGFLGWTGKNELNPVGYLLLKSPCDRWEIVPWSTFGSLARVLITLILIQLPWCSV